MHADSSSRGLGVRAKQSPYIGLWPFGGTWTAYSERVFSAARSDACDSLGLHEQERRTRTSHFGTRWKSRKRGEDQLTRVISVSM